MARYEHGLAMGIQNVTFYQNNSGVIQISGVMDNGLTPPMYVNAATSITATLNDPNGNPVALFNNVVGVYVTGSNGTYSFPVPANFNAPSGGGYALIVNITAPSGAIGYWKIPAIVMVRQS
jgi:hypothetical protein